MKLKFAVLGVLVVVGLGGVASQLKLEETILSARYDMPACEGCFHLTVEKSKTSSLIGETIIPVSSTLDVEQLMDSIASTREPFCLRGRLYRFNVNLLGFRPDGKRFDVIAKENLEGLCRFLIGRVDVAHPAVEFY